MLRGTGRLIFGHWSKHVPNSKPWQKDPLQSAFGLPHVYKTLQQERSGKGQAAPFEVPLLETVPSLVEMTQAALNVLDKIQRGFISWWRAVPWIGLPMIINPGA